MFGTLVIQLPSNYSGGQLIVYHQSKSMEFDFGGPIGCTDIHYAAFYADCQHEIKPVTKGYRLCLIYNLVYRGSGNCPAPADNQQIVSSVISSMREWGEDLDPPMMTYLLEHQYCEASLSFQLLKNSDRSVADVLIQAKKEVEFDLYVGMVNIVENWSATSYGYDGGYSQEDLLDKSVTANDLKSCDGRSISSIDLDKDYFVPEDFFDTLDPDEEFEEATGNEGATLDKQYNWAALLFWPSKNRIENLGLANVIQSLNEDMYDLPISEDKKAELEIIAKKLVIECASSRSVSTESYVLLFEAVYAIGKAELISEFLDVIASSSSVHNSLIGHPSFCDKILTIGLEYGWDMLRSPLQAIYDKMSSGNSVEKYGQFLFKITQKLLSEVHKDVCRGLAGSFMKVLSGEQDASQVRYTSASGSRGANFLLILFKCLMALQCDQHLSTLIQVVRTKPNHYSIVDTVVPACEGLYKSLKEDERGNKFLKHLLSHCISCLVASSSRVIPCPTNWSEMVTFSCSCNDCQGLMQFLRHPVEKQGWFKMAKGRRDHLQHHLRVKKCSVAVSTECVGSPHTLVVTKTREAYERDCQRVQKERSILSRLRALNGESSSTGKPMAKRQKVVDIDLTKM